MSYIYALSFCDGIDVLPAPSIETPYGSGLGFFAAAPYLDNYCIRISVPETGFEGTLPLPENTDRSMYDDRGRCVQPERAAQVGTVCVVQQAENQEQAAFELVQPVTGAADMERLGSLISTVTWDGAEYVVLGQRLEQAS